MTTSNGKVAIITGASAGIGKASAVALLKAGYSVAFAGRRQAELEAVAIGHARHMPDFRPEGLVVLCLRAHGAFGLFFVLSRRLQVDFRLSR